MQELLFGSPFPRFHDLIRSSVLLEKGVHWFPLQGHLFFCMYCRGKAFAVSIAWESQVKITDYVGLCSGRDVDKWVETGLSVVKSDLVDAPYATGIPLSA